MQVGHDWDEMLIKKTLLVGFLGYFKSGCPGICYLHPDGEFFIRDMINSLSDQCLKVLGGVQNELWGVSN